MENIVNFFLRRVFEKLNYIKTNFTKIILNTGLPSNTVLKINNIRVIMILKW